MVALCEAAAKGDWKKALALHYALSPLFRSMFIDTNPIPVKKAVELVGMAGGPVRLPLDNLDEKKTAELKKILACHPGRKKTCGYWHRWNKEKTSGKEKPAVSRS